MPYSFTRVAVVAIHGFGQSPGPDRDLDRGHEERVTDLHHALRVVHGNAIGTAASGLQADSRVSCRTRSTSVGCVAVCAKAMAAQVKVEAITWTDAGFISALSPIAPALAGIPKSDAFQVEINQRFPVFFSEKRPFFMEGAGLFNLAGNAQGDAAMLYAVHTRRIVDPIVGAKVTGSAGRVTFGTLTAVDQAPGRREDRHDPLFGREKLFQVARAQGQVQVLRWLRPYANVNWGTALFYDQEDPFVGRSVSGRVGATIQPGGRFSENVEFSRSIFDHPVTGTRVYTVNVVNTRTTYQFSKEFALRAIVRYESQRHRVLTDFLGSYEPRPGTVVYAGYGSLLEKRDYRAPDWIDDEGRYLTTGRGLFLKASYLYRF